MLMDSTRSALVLVDYQSRLMPAIDAGESAVREAVFLAQVARELGVPVLGTEQNPARLGPNDARIRALCERTFAKMQFSAATRELVGHLRSRDRPAEQLVLAGCEAHVCLLQTVLELQRLGFHTCVVPGACGSRRPSDRALAMQRLAEAGTVLASAEMVAFEWLRSCEHPAFKAVRALIKERPLA